MAKKAKGKSKNLSGFHPLFTASARRSIALDGLKIWLLLGFVVGVVTGVATGAGAVSVLLGLLIAAVIYFGFRDDVYKKVYGPEHDLLQQKAWYLSAEKHSRRPENDHPDQTVQKQ